MRYLTIALTKGRLAEKTLDMLKFKCWYYEKAMEDGNEDEIHAMLPDKLPADIQALYDNSHDRNNA